MKQCIILIDGMTGGGKTTAAKLLSEKLPRTAVIGFDRIKKFVSDFERGTRDNNIAREVTQAMAKKYLELGLSLIVEQPFRTDEEVNFYSALAHEYEIPCHKFQLYAEPETAFGRVLKRTEQNNGDLTEERVQRNISLFESREHLGFALINTTEKDPQEAAKIILKEIKR